MSSQQDDASQPDQAGRYKKLNPPEEATQSEHSFETPSDDTVLVWREVKYYRSLQQPSMDGLYADFREIFDGWTKERFQKIHPEALRALKYALRSGGVYTGPTRKHSADALADIAQLPCVENGMWPRAPEWELIELLMTRFTPGSEAKARQKVEYEKMKTQQALQPQPAHPQMPRPQQTQSAPPPAPAAHRPSPGQFAVRQAFPPPGLGLPSGTQAQPAPAIIQGATLQPPGNPIQQAPFPASTVQVQPPQGMCRLGESQWQARQSQQQPGAQPQTNLALSNSGATRTPQPSIPRPHVGGTNRNRRSEPYGLSRDLLRSTLLQRAATVSGSRNPVMPALSNRVIAAKDDRDNDDSNEM